MPEMIRILCEGLATLLFALICTRFLCKNMKKRDFRFVPWLPYVLTGCGSAMLFLLGGLSPWTFCGIAFLFVLLYASVQDHSTHEADDILSVMMLMLAVTNISEATVLSQLLGATIVGGVQMLIALCGKKRMGIGGADIKLSTAAALLLGFYKGVIGFVLGLLIAVVAQLIMTHRKKEQRTQPFALLPYLSVGFIIGYLI